jgi:hypothetical protein
MYKARSQTVRSNTKNTEIAGVCELSGCELFQMLVHIHLHKQYVSARIEIA